MGPKREGQILLGRRGRVRRRSLMPSPSGFQHLVHHSSAVPRGGVRRRSRPHRELLFSEINSDLVSSRRYDSGRRFCCCGLLGTWYLRCLGVFIPCAFGSLARRWRCGRCFLPLLVERLAFISHHACKVFHAVEVFCIEAQPPSFEFWRLRQAALVCGLAGMIIA